MLPHGGFQQGLELHHFGDLLAGEHPAHQHPLAILVLMRCMFNWRQIPKMMELKELLLTTVAEHPEWSQEEKGNLLGECDLILSFLMYNDICLLYTSRQRPARDAPG